MAYLSFHVATTSRHFDTFMHSVWFFLQVRLRPGSVVPEVIGQGTQTIFATRRVCKMNNHVFDGQSLQGPCLVGI